MNTRVILAGFVTVLLLTQAVSPAYAQQSNESGTIDCSGERLNKIINKGSNATLEQIREVHTCYEDGEMDDSDREVVKKFLQDQLPGFTVDREGTKADEQQQSSKSNLENRSVGNLSSQVYVTDMSWEENTLQLTLESKSVATVTLLDSSGFSKGEPAGEGIRTVTILPNDPQTIQMTATDYRGRKSIVLAYTPPGGTPDYETYTKGQQSIGWFSGTVPKPWIVYALVAFLAGTILRVGKWLRNRDRYGKPESAIDGSEISEDSVQGVSDYVDETGGDDE